MKSLVFDSTPLIHLTRVSSGEFLRDVPGEKFAPAAVFVEVVEEGKRRGIPEAVLVEGLFTEGVVKVQNHSDGSYLGFVRELAAEGEVKPLHEGEVEVLCLAKELNGIAVADDQAARSVAGLLGVELHGTGFVLGRIFATGRIGRKELKGKVKVMRDAGWFVSAEDYMAIMEYLGSVP